MVADSFSSALGSVIPALLLGASIYVYSWLVRQIQARESEPPVESSQLYGWPEAILAAFLCILFLWLIAKSISHHEVNLQTRDLILGATIPVGLFLFIASFLRVRQFDLDALGGFSRIGFGRVAGFAVLLLLAAYPLIVLAELLTEKLARGTLERQEIIEVFSASGTIEQRVVIILLAVSLAPLTEEFFFRLFLYGVLKRYLGRGVGVMINAFLFAAVHAHLPSFAPLFVLGICLTIAYEWSGSILVSMTMHALFNALTLMALAFPEVFSQ